MIDKTTTTSTYSAVGDTITYDFAVTNNGNVTLTDVTINDASAGLSAISCTGGPITSLAPGATVDCTATYTVTQADLDAGSVTNSSSASGTAPDSSTVTSGTSTVTVDATQSPSLLIDKTTTTSTYSAVGDTITYDFAVTNNGNVTLTDVTINDALAGLSAISCTGGPITSLAPGATVDCTATYAVTQADLDAGSVTNSSSASGTAPDSSTVTSGNSTVTVDATRARRC